MANDIVKSVTVNSFLMLTPHKDGSYTVCDFIKGKVAFQAPCANVHVARSVIATMDTEGYEKARHTLVEMNASYEFFQESK